MSATYVWGVDASKRKLTACLLTDRRGLARMGESIAVDGNTMIVGAPYTAPFGLYHAGTARVYVSDGRGGWVLQAELTASDAAEDNEFGWSVSVGLGRHGCRRSVL